MSTPAETVELCRWLHEFNKLLQSIDWLQYAQYQVEDNVHMFKLKHEHSTIEVYSNEQESAMLLWIDASDEVPMVPMDNIKPQWDATPFLQQCLTRNNTVFPNAVLWSNNQHSEWESPWLATTWWPLEGVTDAIDNPALWIKWLWKTIMEFTTPIPALYTPIESITI